MPIITVDFRGVGSKRPVKRGRQDGDTTAEGNFTREAMRLARYAKAELKKQGIVYGVNDEAARQTVDY